MQKVRIFESAIQTDRVKNFIHRLPVRCLFLCMLLLVISQKTHCQDKIFKGAQNKIGFQFGFGDQERKLIFFNLSLNVSYTYEVYFFQFQYYRSLLMRNKWGIDFLIQPQYNMVRLMLVDDDNNRVNAHDCVVNCAFLVRRNFSDDKYSLYGMIGTGPHFISKAPTRQEPGFIFSDNINLGFNFRISNQVYFDLRPGFRHISNAGIENPNKGINTYTLTAGVMIVL